MLSNVEEKMKHSLMLLQNNVEKNTKILLKRMDKCDTLEELVRVAFKDKEEVFQIAFETYCNTRLPSIIRLFQEGISFQRCIVTRFKSNVRISPYQAYTEYYTAINDFYLESIIKEPLKRFNTIQTLQEEAFRMKQMVFEGLFQMLQV